MQTLRVRGMGILILAAAAIMLSPSDGYARRSAASNFRLLDTNKDQRIEIGEAKQGADAVFTRLDKDKKGSLDERELKGRLTKSDATLGGKPVSWPVSRADYVAIVEERFNAADTGKTGKLTLQQLISPAGDRLITLAVFVIVR